MIDPPIRFAQHFKTLREIRTPRVMRAVTGIVSIGTCAIVLFLALAPWVQTSVGTGTVTSLRPEDRLQTVDALVPGRIDQWFVRDGSRVRAGDPIVRIVDIDPRLLERLAAERAQATAKYTAARSAVRTARLDETRMRGLHAEGLAARRDYEFAQIKVAEHEAAMAEASAARTRLDVQLSRQSAQTVSAPRDGTILKIKAGDASTAVAAGDPIATFLPDTANIAVELYISGRDAPLVRPGRKVRLQFEGWPAVQFAGWPSVAVGSFAGIVVSVDPSAALDGRFRTLVAPDPSGPPWPEPQFLRFGGKAQGWVLLETVSVGFELWRQLNNFPPASPRSTPGSAAAAAEEGPR